MANAFQDAWRSYEGFLRDRSQPWTNIIARAEQSTGVDRTYLVSGGAVFVGLYLIFGIGSELVCNAIAVAYPAYMSMRALESPQKDDDTKWLTYWTVYAVMSLFEYFSDFIAGWFPLYWFIKCLFVIWCFNPTEYNGSLVIYRRVIRPYYLKNHGKIDQLADQASKLVSDAVKKAT